MRNDDLNTFDYIKIIIFIIWIVWTIGLIVEYGDKPMSEVPMWLWWILR